MNPWWYLTRLLTSVNDFLQYSSPQWYHDMNKNSCEMSSYWTYLFTFVNNFLQYSSPQWFLKKNIDPRGPGNASFRKIHSYICEKSSWKAMMAFNLYIYIPKRFFFNILHRSDISEQKTGSQEVWTASFCKWQVRVFAKMIINNNYSLSTQITNKTHSGSKWDYGHWMLPGIATSVGGSDTPRKV